MRGQQDRMKVTACRGSLPASISPPNVPGIACPEDLERYVPDEDKVNNKWVKVGDDGCLQYVDADTMEWVSSDRCGLDDYAGWCFLDNVSQDEYSGHMLALAAVARLVDDAEVQDMVYGLLLQVGQHPSPKTAWSSWIGMAAAPSTDGCGLRWFLGVHGGHGHGLHEGVR